MTDVHGTVEPGFESVREVFAGIAADEARDGGAQLAVHHHGRLVVDLWGGDGVDGDSLLALYSSSKGAMALVVALLVQGGAPENDRLTPAVVEAAAKAA
ncbi:serine hydrolase [Streptomyces sp. NPDC053513]|uniref:Serine hydrolase n=1 Tax=Streptomyces litmocidini TaxID=67318 RepID=A0ABW7U4B5_9ACTN